MLSIRQAVKTALGASFSVTHQASPVTVNVIDAGAGDASYPLPIVAIVSEFGASEFASIGAGAVRNDTSCDLDIQTQDDDNVSGAVLLVDIHSKVESLIRAVEKTLGASYASLVADFRDFPPQAQAGEGGSVFFVYRRVLTVRAVNYQAY